MVISQKGTGLQRTLVFFIGFKIVRNTVSILIKLMDFKLEKSSLNSEAQDI